MPEQPTTTLTRPWLRRKTTWAVIVALLAVGLTLVYLVKPDGVAFYPKCFFHVVTGLDCPGCGATRSVNRLLHGQFTEAWQFNPLFVTILLPCFLYWFIHYAWHAWHGLKLPSRLLPNWAAYSLLVMVAVFGILRNTPIYPYKTSELSRRQQSAADARPSSQPLTNLP